MTKNYAIPTLIPYFLKNKGNYIISLGELTKWMAEQAEELGVEIFPGFSGSEIIYDENNHVAGIASGDVGLDKDRNPTESFTRGVELRAKISVLAEGCRGSLSEQVMEKFNLRKDCDPQTYGLGVKEVWEVDPKKFKSGLVQHTTLWPSPLDTQAGSFMYHMEPNLVHIGYVTALNYTNPYLSPYKEFQKWKQHPKISSYLEGGKCISYGGRCLNEGGLQSIPRLYFPGGVLVGCSAGFMNAARIKGSHTAIKSGILAGDAIYEFLQNNKNAAGGEIEQYEINLKKS